MIESSSGVALPWQEDSTSVGPPRRLVQQHTIGIWAARGDSVRRIPSGTIAFCAASTNRVLAFIPNFDDTAKHPKHSLRRPSSSRAVPRGENLHRLLSIVTSFVGVVPVCTRKHHHFYRLSNIFSQSPLLFSESVSRVV